MPSAVIIDAVRTPRARRKGRLSSLHPVDLLTYPLNALLARSNLDAALIEDVIVGCVTQSGEQSWCIGRTAVLAAGWPFSVPGTTINRLCGSSLQALHFAVQGIESGAIEVAIAGGVEHMTRAPMFSDIGGEVSPLLRSFHPDLVSQGLAAELLSEKYGVSREDMDEFALHSQKKAKAAQAGTRFKKSLISVPYRDEHGLMTALDSDDTPRLETTAQALSQLQPVFKENGRITAGNASAIADGSAAVLVMSENKAAALGLPARARVRAQAVVGSDPRLMLDGTVEAARSLLKKAKLSADAVDLWEINEAFAPVPLFTIEQLRIDPGKVNVNGGAIALGHPLGATGAILLGTLIDELELRQLRYGVVVMCIGLGMGIATLVERQSG